MDRCKHGMVSEWCGMCGSIVTLHGAIRTVDGKIIFPEDHPRPDNDQHLFQHWDEGEAIIGMMEHVSKMSGLERMIVEDCIPGQERPNRVSPAHRDRAPYFDSLDRFAKFVNMVNEDGRIDPLAKTLMDSFRALELDEKSRKQLAIQVRNDRTKAATIIFAAHEVSKEIIPPIPTMGCPLLDAVDHEEEIDPTGPPDWNATPIGELANPPEDWMNASTIRIIKGKAKRIHARSQTFRSFRLKYRQAVHQKDGKMLSLLGKELYSSNGAMTIQERSAMWYIHKVANAIVEHKLRHRLDALLHRIEIHPEPKRLGRALFELAESSDPKRPHFTSSQWKAIWTAYRKRVPVHPEPPPIEEKSGLFD